MILRSSLYLSGLFITGMFASCVGSRTVTHNEKPATDVTSSADELYAHLIAIDNYTWYTGKAKINASTSSESMSATINLRILKDSVIWATIEKFSLEVARVLITPDSVHLIDRINREYSVKPLAEFMNKYGVYIEFGDLQNALVGKMIALTPRSVVLTQEGETDILLVTDPNNVTARHWVTSSLPYRLLKSFLIDTRNRELTIENVNWQRYENGNEIPYGRVLSFKDGDRMTNLELLFSEISKNVPASLPFSVPDNYAHTH